MKNNNELQIYKSHLEALPVFVSLFISGIYISGKFVNDLYITWLIITLVSIILSYLLKSPKGKTYCLLIAALSVSIFYGTIRQKSSSDFSDLLVLDNTSGILYGRYTGQYSIKNRKNIVYTFKEVTYTTDEQPIDIPVKINCQTLLNRERLYPEQYYSMTGKFKVISFDKSPVFEVASFTPVEQKLPSVLTIAKQLQEKIKNGLQSVLKEEHASLVSGFILGDSSDIKDKSLFIETGISHVLAISGQHIMILILLIASILHWFKIPPISRAVSISLLLCFYAMITVGSPSVWRALIMYISVTVIMMLESSSSPIRPISIAALIMLLYDPDLLYNTGFILSFTAVLSIIFLRSPFEYILNKIHLPKVLNKYLATTFAANLGITPMVAYLFGTLSLSSIFVNPLILWTFTFILPISFFIAIISIFSIPTAILFSSGLSVLLDLLISFLEKIKSIPGLYFYVGNIHPISILLIYSFMLFLSGYFNKYLKKRIKLINNKKEIEEIPTTELPKEKSIEIHIDKDSKATPTLLGEKIPTTIKTNFNPNEFSNPLKNDEIVKAIDEMLSELKRIKTNKNEKSLEIIPVNDLNVDSQNVYYRLFDMNQNLFLEEPERLLQAHIFMLSLVGYELINRINSNLKTPISIDKFSLTSRIDDKYLVTAILADSIMESNFINSVENEQLKQILDNGKNLFLKAQILLRQILNDKKFKKSISQHIALREVLVKWCWEYVQYDNQLKQNKKKNQR